MFPPLYKSITFLMLYLFLLASILIFFFKGTLFKVSFKSEIWKTLVHTFILIGKFNL